MHIVMKVGKIWFWWLNSNFDYELHLERFGSVVFRKIVPAKTRSVASIDCEGGKQKVSPKERRHDAGGDIILLLSPCHFAAFHWQSDQQF